MHNTEKKNISATIPEMGPPSVTSQLWHQVSTALCHSPLPGVSGSADHQCAGMPYCLRSYSEPQLGVELRN